MPERVMFFNNARGNRDITEIVIEPPVEGVNQLVLFDDELQRIRTNAFIAALQSIKPDESSRDIERRADAFISPKYTKAIKLGFALLNDDNGTNKALKLWPLCDESKNFDITLKALKEMEILLLCLH